MHDETHVVKFTPDGFTIQHPLAERERGMLWDCNLHKSLEADIEMPVERPGLYSAEWLDGEWVYQALKVEYDRP